MADDKKTFDVFDNEGKALAEGKESPVTITGLHPATTYSGWKMAYAGQPEQTDIPEFTTLDVLPGKPTIKATAGDKLIKATLTDGDNQGSDINKRQIIAKPATGDAVVKDVESGSEITIDELTNDVEYSVTAEVTNGKGKIASDAIKVTPKAPVINMESFKLDPASLTGEVGKSGKVTLSNVLPANTTNKKVDASSSDDSIATVKDNGDSTYTVSFVKVGEATINFGAADGKGAHGSVSVKVNPATVAVTGVTLDDANAKTGVSGNSVTLKAAVAPSNATNKNVSWESSDESVAKIDNNGVLTLLKAGKTTITVKTADGAKTASFEFTVTDPVPQNVKITPDATTAQVTAN